MSKSTTPEPRIGAFRQPGDVASRFDLDRLRVRATPRLAGLLLVDVDRGAR